MKYFILFLISLPAFAGHFSDDIKSYGQKGDEVTVRFSAHEKIYRLPASEAAVPCLEDGWKARKPVDVTVTEKGTITDCKLAPRALPGAAGK